MVRKSSGNVEEEERRSEVRHKGTDFPSGSRAWVELSERQ